MGLFSRPAASNIGLRPEDDVEIQDREDQDSLNEVIMAIEMRNRGTVGCSYYIARNETLYLLSDVKSGGLEVIDTCRCIHLSTFARAIAHTL